MQPKNIIIIGGGPAALSAAIYVKRSGQDVLMLEKEAFGGQIADSPKVENYPGHSSISGLELSNLMFEQVTTLGADFDMDEVLKIEKREHEFAVKCKYSEYSAKAVIIASGVKHRHLNIKGENELLGKGVSYCAVCDGAFQSGKDVVVIGDANSALQYALSLSSLCRSVTIATLFDKFFADASLVEALNKANNITVFHNLQATSFNGEESLTSVSFLNRENGESVEINASGAFVAIGQVPDNERFANLLQLEKGYIEVDSSMSTSTPGLFAAGDCTNKKIRQLTTACSDGAIAALSAVSYINTLKE